MTKFILGVLLGIIVVGGVWYWIDSDKATAPEPKPETALPPNWEDVTSGIKTALRNSGETIEERATLRIVDKKDLTGDGFPEALIDTGSGGAYTMYMALLQMKDRKPVVAQIKDRDNKTFALSGWPVGASAMHGQDLELMPQSKAVALGNYEIDGRTADIKLAECRNEVYAWNSVTSLFEWNAGLSETATKTYCAKVESRIGQ